MEQKIPPYWSRYIDNIDIKMLDIPNKKDLINNILVLQISKNVLFCVTLSSLAAEFHNFLKNVK